MPRMHGAAFIHVSEIDLIVGFGDGSAVDAAKVLAVLAPNDDHREDYVGVEQGPPKGLPSSAVPTAAGTGTEVTAIAIFSNQKLNVKQGAVSPHLIPDIALVDPVLTNRRPQGVTAAGGVDAVTHNTLMLPWVTEYNVLAFSQFFKEIGDLMSEIMEGLSDREGCEVTPQVPRTLAEDLEVPQYLNEVGIPGSALPDLVKSALTQARPWNNNPRQFTAEDMEQVYRNMAVRPSRPPRARPPRPSARCRRRPDRDA